MFPNIDVITSQAQKKIHTIRGKNWNLMNQPAKRLEVTSYPTQRHFLYVIAKMTYWFF